MMTHETHQGRSSAGRSGLRHLLPIAGITAAVVAAVAHFGVGGLLMHVGLPAALAYFGLGAALPELGAGALVIGIVGVVAIKLLLVFGVFKGAFGARRWWRRR